MSPVGSFVPSSMGGADDLSPSRLKYYYLLFSAPDVLSLDDYVFTTEAHSFRVRAKDDAPFWKGEKLKMPERPLGQGSHVQQWARVLQAAYSRGWRYKR